MLRNCRYCGRLLTTPPGTPCPDCLAEEEAAVAKIEAYLGQGGMPTVSDVAQDTGVALVLLRRLVREGRIHLSEGPAGGVCVLCGKPLEGAPGRLCPRCAAKVAGEARHASKHSQAQSAAAEAERRTGYYSLQPPRKPRP